MQLTSWESDRCDCWHSAYSLDHEATSLSSTLTNPQAPAPSRPAATTATPTTTTTSAQATEGEAPFRPEYEPRHAKGSSPGATGVSSGTGGYPAGTAFGTEEAAPTSFHAYEPRIATDVANQAGDRAAELAESAR